MNGNGQLIQGWVGCLFCVTEEILWNFEYIIWLMVYKRSIISRDLKFLLRMMIQTPASASRYADGDRNAFGMDNLRERGGDLSQTFRGNW